MYLAANHFAVSAALVQVLLRHTRKLRHYFESHIVKRLTNQPLNDVFRNRNASGRVGKWEMELLEYVIDFEKRSSAKSHVLTDFIVDWTSLGYFGDGPVIEAY